MRALIARFVLVLVLIAPPAAGQELLHRERSLYRNIFVTQIDGLRCMLFRYPEPAGRESCVFLNDRDRMVFYYTRMMLPGLYLNPRPRKILIIGEGGGTIPTVLQQLLPGAHIDVVEIDAAVDRIARDYFNFEPGPNMRVTISDGRVFVKRAMLRNSNYDLVMLDAFDVDYIPEHMLTREFLEEVKSILAPHGVIVANTYSDNALYDSESVTYRAVFGPFFNLRLENRIIIGRVGDLPAMDEVRENAMQLETEFKKYGAGSSFLLPLFSPETDWDPHARILSDQYSPSNLLNALPLPQ